ncbi:hypothetical protein DTO006G1_6773 [Penicillium roqueforti]|nr:hypothetical protein DTO006G1_6773 [Penicillium roqueforti]KAI3248858.1 hypothetical protein DTO006G7_9749 [Penicillium roqueforti]
MALKKTSPDSHQGLTPPDSPTKESTMSPATLKDLMLLFGEFLENALLDLADQEPPNTPVSQDQSPPGLDMVRLKQLMVKLTHDECGSAEPSLATKPVRSSSASNEQQENVQAIDEIDIESQICTTPDDFKLFEKWALKSQFKTVVEVWDKEAYKYRIAEPTETSNDLDDYAEYAFVVRECIDRTSKEVVSFIDIKSEGLRDILRDVLYNIKAVSLIEDKLSIEQNVLFYFLLELDRYTENMDSSLDHKSAYTKHLLLLIEYLNGLPGVGKTFTVKVTSEYFKLSLYSFDNAILSRIHLIIKYENLTREFRRDLWSTFLSKACTIQGPAIVEEHELRRLESLALNGREIKNVAAIAHALAEANVNRVNYKYLKLAAELNKKFSKEFGRERPADGMYV